MTNIDVTRKFSGNEVFIEIKLFFIYLYLSIQMHVSNFEASESHLDMQHLILPLNEFLFHLHIESNLKYT